MHWDLPQKKILKRKKTEIAEEGGPGKSKIFWGKALKKRENRPEA